MPARVPFVAQRFCAAFVPRWSVSRFRLSRDVRDRQAAAAISAVATVGCVPCLSWRARFAAQVVESGRRETAHSKMERGDRRAQAEPGARQGQAVGQAAASSSSRRVWKARLPILRATVSRATVVSRRSRVAR